MVEQRAPSSDLRLTAAQLAAKPPAEPGLGERLYQQTNELAFGAPFASYSGRHGDEVYHERGGKCYVRRYVVPRTPDAVRQIEQQNRMAQIMPHWQHVPAPVRQAWLDYSIQHFGPEQFGKKTGNLGQNLYTSAQLNRLSRGDNLRDEAPTAPPPQRVIQLVEVPAPEGQMAWRVEHGTAQTDGYNLEVRMTPPGKGARKPRQCKLVRAGQTTEQSFFPLGASGTIYLLAQPVYAVAPGQRYGLEVKLITSDGVPGRALYIDLTRKAPGTLPADVVIGSETLRLAVSEDEGGSGDSARQQGERVKSTSWEAVAELEGILPRRIAVRDP